MTLAGKNVSLKKTGSPTAMVQESCTEISGTVFQITDSARRILDRAATFVVRSATVVIDPLDYTIDTLFGIITFDSTQTGLAVDITGDFLVNFTYAEGRSVSANFGMDLEDDTVLEEDAHGMKETLQTFDATVERLEVGLTDIDPGGGTLRVADDLRAGTPRVFELSPDGVNAYRAWFKYDNDAITGAFDGLAGATASLQGDGPGAGTANQLQSQVWSFGLI